MPKLKVLILGGYGTFGGRVAQLLADEERLSLLVAGRLLARARSFCAQLAARAECTPVQFDRDGDLAAQLGALAPALVVDATGPFQAYGDDPYRVVEAALALGIDYLDLADGSDFVAGIAKFDAGARTRGVFLLSGVSSFPVLTAAVVRQLADGMAQIETVTGGIAPSPYAGVGLNVIRAIASYAGKRVAASENRPIGVGLVDARRFTIAPPGWVPLSPRRFSLVDVPDLRVLPVLWPQLKSVWMGAGPVPAVLHRALTLLAWLVGKGLLPSLSPFAPLMHRAINLLRWGEDRGGMFVAVTGRAAQGKPLARSWHLVAEGKDGPLIPSMAVEAVIRKVLAGARPPAGARNAACDLDLADYDALFARRAIHTGRREAPSGAATPMPLYWRILAEAWSRLPSPLQSAHDLSDQQTLQGRAQVERGNGLLARCVAALMRFPAAGADVPVTVSFSAEAGRETWRRDFAGRSFMSTQEEGQGRYEGLLVERFGPLAFGLALVVEEGRLRLVARRWSAFGIPLPLALAPGGEAFESADEGRFNFHVEIGHRLTGLIVRYRGWLAPRDPA